MTGPYQYTPYLWPTLASAVFMWALGVYGWRHRSAPGATSFSLLALIVGLWALGSAFEISSTDYATKFLWFRFQGVLGLPTAICGLCFALEYSGLGHWLSRRKLALLGVPALVFLAFYFVGDPSVILARVWFEGSGRREFTPFGVALNAYGLALMLLTTVIMVVLFVRSPLHRQPVALILIGQAGSRAGYVLEALNVIPATQLDGAVLGASLTAVMYAIALYRFRLFDVVPMARASVVERMGDGMVVLDAADRIADLNPAAQELLGAQRSRFLGRNCAEALAPFPALAELTCDPTPRQVEVQMGTPPNARWHQVSSSPLTDQRGFRLGSLIVLHDITALKQARERLLRQERTLAALHERERLARELHDSLGQVLGYVSLQAEATRKLLEDGKVSVATAQLGRLASVARDAHADVREFILALRAAPAEQRAFFPALRRYLEGFTQNYGIATALVPPDGLSEPAFEPEAQAQLFRIIQEALSNARKHGGARSVKVTFEKQDGLASVVIEDDGTGFDPQAAGGGFGLRFMCERAAELGGNAEVQSAPGVGTRVVVELPLGRPQSV
jgi:PAS domain S-box-containing protein